MRDKSLDTNIKMDSTRLEVIDETGRAYTRWNIKSLTISYQDDGRTVKLFVNSNLGDCDDSK